MYTEVGDGIDGLTKRIDGLGGIPLRTLGHTLEAASLKEEPDHLAPESMVKHLLDDLGTLSAGLLAAIEGAEGQSDRTTVNLLDEVRDGLEVHQWMLRAWLTKWHPARARNPDHLLPNQPLKVANPYAFSGLTASRTPPTATAISARATGNSSPTPPVPFSGRGN